MLNRNLMSDFNVSIHSREWNHCWTAVLLPKWSLEGKLAIFQNCGVKIPQVPFVFKFLLAFYSLHGWEIKQILYLLPFKFSTISAVADLADKVAKVWEVHECDIIGRLTMTWTSSVWHYCKLAKYLLCTSPVIHSQSEMGQAQHTASQWHKTLSLLSLEAGKSLPQDRLKAKVLPSTSFLISPSGHMSVAESGHLR